ncbi:MAG: pseudouridine synthase [Acidobacteriota bacterium]|nr:pseudouridine synthase [Acidobacteriota bacterium]
MAVDDSLSPEIAPHDPGWEERGVRPSTVKLPGRAPEGVRTIFDFFLHRFPRIEPGTWSERFAADKVWAEGRPIDADSPFEPLLEVHYRREVEREPSVRTDFRVVWANQHLLVVDKPPNLPVTPGGLWVRNCLLQLLADVTGSENITPLHRIDRLTSGLVLFSIDPTSRSHFAQLFQPRMLVEKTYTAVCELQRDPPSPQFSLAHHIARNQDEYWRQAVMPGLPANAQCEVEVMAVDGNLALVQIRPSTGRKHQIRVQLAHAGLPILGDPLYGTVRSYDPENLSQRMWLDAYRLVIRNFPDPTGSRALTGDWVSSRQPSRFLEDAARWRRGAAPD